MSKDKRQEKILEKLVLLPMELTQEEKNLKELLDNSQTLKDELKSIKQRQKNFDRIIIPTEEILEISQKIQQLEDEVKKSLKNEINYFNEIIEKGQKYGEFISEDIGWGLRQALIRARRIKKDFSTIIISGTKLIKRYKVENILREENYNGNAFNPNGQLNENRVINLMLKRHTDLWLQEDDLEKRKDINEEIKKLINQTIEIENQQRLIDKEKAKDRLDAEKNRLLIIRLYFSIGFSVVVTILGLYFVTSSPFSALGSMLLTFGLVGLGINLSGLVKISI